MGQQGHIAVVTGLSGAGRSTVLNALEDLGFYCVDNLPPALSTHFSQLAAEQDGLQRLALGLDLRAGGFLGDIDGALGALEHAGHHVEVLFVEASDAALVNRFNETRRSHPLADKGDLLPAIARERELLSTLRARATRVFDTSRWSKHDLRRAVVEHIAGGDARSKMRIRVLSFGFKFGIPMDADLMFDVRFLPNPHFVPELKPKTGEDDDVYEFVMKHDEAKSHLDHVAALLRETIPLYEREGKTYLTIAIGCTGGKHRSVSMARALVRELSLPMESIEHRDHKK